MNAKELRINDLIKFDDESNEIIEVYGISIDDSGDVWILSKDGENSMIEEFEPIPLTEEWLLKFGFKTNITDKIFSLYEYIIGRHKISIWINTKNTILCVYIQDIKITPNSRIFIEENTMQYVHQLQNLVFALTGEELQFKTKSDE